MKPFLLRPVTKDYIWGGTRLREEFGKESDSERIAESWELSCHPDGECIIASGEYSGMKLSEFVRRYPAAVGKNFRSEDRFPVLVKLIDAKSDLSIQVHPDDKYAMAHEGDSGKTEMWYILAAAPGAELYVGLRAGVTRESFESAIASGTVAECFHRISTRAGDCMFLPSGRVHAIGAGHLIAEIQQNSDTTFRVYDWDRKGLDGKPRALHVAESLECIDFSDTEPGLQRPDGECLVRCPHFTVQLAALGGGRIWDGGRERAYVFVPVGGRVAAGDREAGPGELFLQPAAAGPLRVRPIDASAKVLVTTF